MFTIATVFSAFGHEPDLSTIDETLIAGIVLGVTYILCGLLFHTFAKKSKAGAKMSPWWGVRNSYTMTDDETFAYAHKNVWKYLSAVAICCYVAGIFSLLIATWLYIAGVSIINIAVNAITTSTIILFIVMMSILMYSCRIVNKTAKEFLEEREKSLDVKAEEK